MKAKLLAIALISSVVSANQPVFAQFPGFSSQIQQIVTTSYTQDPLSIVLAAGQGLTISYRDAEQTIETVFLDNKRFVGLDTDGCLNGIQTNCGKGQATTLHLKLIDSAPTNDIEPTDRSMMTVITIDSDGKHHNYIYKIGVDRQFNSETYVAMIEYHKTELANYSVQNKRLFERIQKTIAQGLIKDTPTIEKLRKLTDLIRKGTPIDKATAQVGISQKLIEAILSN